MEEWKHRFKEKKEMQKKEVVEEEKNLAGTLTQDL